MKKLFILIFLIVFENAYSQWIVVSTLPSPKNINSISVVNQNVIWVACDNAALFKTTNGGLIWLSRDSGLPSGNLYGISALDTSNCWVGTVNGSIYHTTNGGINWTLQFSISGSFSNGIKMFNLNNGVYQGDPTGNGQPYQFRYTSNGGTNWILSPGAPIAASEFGLVNAWDWTDTNHFWIGSASTVANATSARVYKTLIGFGGGVWSSATLTGTGSTAGLYYQAIAFTDVNNGMASSNGGVIKKTTDGGLTWTTVISPPGMTEFTAINMNGIKDGSNTIRISLIDDTLNYCFKTTNLGAVWTDETLPSAGQINGIQHMQFLSSTLGFAGGNLGTFMRFGSPFVKINLKVLMEGMYSTIFNQLTRNDSIKIYLRNSSTPYSLVDSAQSTIDSISFSGLFNFNNSFSGDYYIVVKHLNCIETWSKTGGESLNPDGTTYNYDFTTINTQAYGNNLKLKGSKYCLYSGDVNQDGFITLFDVIPIYNDATNFLSGRYLATDLTGDNVVDLTDVTLCYNNSSNFIRVRQP